MTSYDPDVVATHRCVEVLDSGEIELAFFLFRTLPHGLCAPLNSLLGLHFTA
ncbi:hypothetical protein MSAN_02409400 [Mycena sanguinolenta]|uniref:Uncharacterized protein n=1 Tax=Mycena sanguinolenta TaxID=230812 RepID=A0A8H6X3B0_9AGAR|nr:hypothetical protein MSAN_02409400 [Mycena sanguinolenta]